MNIGQTSAARSWSEPGAIAAAALASLDDPVLVLDRAWCQRYANPAAACLFDRAPEALDGRSLRAVVGGRRFDAEFRPYLARCLAGEVVDGECELGRVGHLRRYAVRGRPWTDTDGDVVGILLHLRATDDPRTVAARLDTAMQIGHLAWWEMAMPSGRVTCADSKVTMLGYDPADFADAHYTAFTDLLHPDDHPRAMQAMRDHLAGHALRYEVDYRIKTASGDWKWLHDRGRVTERDADGQPRMVTGMVIDISQLKDLSLRYRRLLDDAPFPLWLVDITKALAVVQELGDAHTARARVLADEHALQRCIDGLVPIDVNDAAMRMHGAADKDELFHLLPDVIDLDDMKRLVEPVLAIHAGKCQYEDEVWFTADVRSGERVFLRRCITCSGVPDRAGRILAQLAAIDFTEAKRFEHELQRSNQESQQFAHLISHDLQEPVRMVHAFGDLLQRHCRARLDEEGREYLRFVVEGAHRIREMIDALLVYSRVQSRPGTIAVVETDSVLDEALANLFGLINKRGVRIVRQALPMVAADRRQLVRVFQNLITNAIRHCPFHRHPEVTIGAETVDEVVTFTVADNGEGIPSADRERVFQLFERGSGANSSEGTGMGLAICKRIVERHGGRIWVDDAAVGARIRFHLG